MTKKQINIYMTKADWERVLNFLKKNNWLALRFDVRTGAVFAFEKFEGTEAENLFFMQTKDFTNPSEIIINRSNYFELNTQKINLIEVIKGAESETHISFSRFSYEIKQIKNNVYSADDEQFWAFAKRFFAFLRRISFRENQQNIFRKTQAAKVKIAV